MWRHGPRVKGFGGCRLCGAVVPGSSPGKVIGFHEAMSFFTMFIRIRLRLFDDTVHLGVSARGGYRT